MKYVTKSFVLGLATLCATICIGLAIVACSFPTSPKPDKDETVPSVSYQGPVGTGGVSFQFNVSKTVGTRGATLITGVDYVSVQLYSEDQKTTLFGTGTVVEGSANISFSGLIPGYWNATARLYDSATAANLLYYGSTRVAVVSGVNASISLPVYSVGTLPIAVTGGIYADEVSVVDLEGYSSATYPVGREYQLVATLSANEDVPDQQVFWTTSNPSVATVNQSGLVRTIALGEAAITATARIGGASSTYSITVAEDYVGTWLQIEDGDGIYYTVFDIGPDTYTQYSWDDYGNTSSNRGTIAKAGSDSFIRTEEEVLELSTGEWIGSESSPFQMYYSLNTDGGITFDPQNFAIYMQKLNSFVPLTGITIDSGTLDSFSSGINAWVTYSLGTTSTPVDATVPVFLYSILRPTLTLDPIEETNFWDESVYTDVTGYSGEIGNDSIYFYFNEALYPVTYKLRIRSLSDPSVVVDIPVLVTGSGY